jgi:hypothetical protein
MKRFVNSLSPMMIKAAGVLSPGPKEEKVVEEGVLVLMLMIL